MDFILSKGDERLVTKMVPSNKESKDKDQMMKQTTVETLVLSTILTEILLRTDDSDKGKNKFRCPQKRTILGCLMEERRPVCVHPKVQRREEKQMGMGRSHGKLSFLLYGIGI